MNSASPMVCQPQPVPTLAIRVYQGMEIAERLPDWEEYVQAQKNLCLSLHPAWLKIFAKSLGHTPYCLEATEDGQIQGFLPLAYLSSRLFGRFLVSLPYINYGGVIAQNELAVGKLVDAAVELADRLQVRFLEIRNERAVEHPRLVQSPSLKVNMRLPLPRTSAQLWSDLNGKVRNQIRKGQKNDLTVCWGGLDLLNDFYAVFSRNMRDLGTPVFGKTLFRSILETFPSRAELCVVRDGPRPLSGALLLHADGITEVPSASSLRRFNHTCANMIMFWSLMERAVSRGQHTFDFGRVTPDSSGFHFKKHWGATGTPAQWQYYLRNGDVTDMRPSNPKYQMMIRIWRRLPVSLTRLVGPACVRCIP